MFTNEFHIQDLNYPPINNMLNNRQKISLQRIGQVFVESFSLWSSIPLSRKVGEFKISYRTAIL